MDYDFSYEKSKTFKNIDRLEGVSKVDRTVLYGDDLRNTHIPCETMNSGVRVGFQDKNGDMFGLNEELLSKHLLLLGGIGSGKSNVLNFMIESLQKRLTNKDVMLVFDSKGDYKEKFYRKNDYSHIIIGNQKEYRDISLSWNIFDEFKNEEGDFDKDSEELVKEIVSELFEGRESSVQPFFTQAAIDLTSKIFIHLIRKAKKSHTEHLLHTDLFVKYVQEASINTYYNMLIDKDNPDFIGAISYIGNPNQPLTPQTLGIFSTIQSMVNDLFVGIFKNRGANGSFAMRQLIQKKQGKTIFIEYDIKKGQILMPIYRLLIDLSLKESLGGRNKDRGNVYFVLDEFRLLPNLKHIEDALNYGRSLGVKVIAGLQSIKQLSVAYGEDIADVISSGFMNIFCFQTFDSKSRKFICERFGETFETITYRPTTEAISFQRNAHVIEEWQISELGVGEAFIQLVGYKPFKFKFNKYEELHRVL